MVAVDGLEGGDLKPLGEEVGLGGSGEATDVGTGDGESGEAEVEEHGCGHAEVVPCGGVVTGPGGGVALASRVRGSGEDEGALVGFELEEAFVGGAGVLHAEDVMDLEVGGGAGFEAGLGDAVLDVVRHGFGWGLEDGGFVHVVPEAGDAVFIEL